MPDAFHTDETDSDYPPPPDADDIDDVPADHDGGIEQNPVIVPEPVPLTPAPSLPVPRARRHLKEMHEAIKTAMAELTRLRLGEQVTLDAVAIDALVCGAVDRQYPLGDGARIDQLRERARAGEFAKYVPLALDELEDVIAVLEAALSALKAVSLLGEPIPANWGNLHPVHLARKLNVLGHTLLRGRIAGVNL
jgi:hypothetical protein